LSDIAVQERGSLFSGLIEGEVSSKEALHMGTSQTVVYTCGTFDLFHVGHLNMLQNARGLGDKLIVAVSTDELVGEYKGKQTMVPYEERVKIVSALRCVDCVIPQHDRDKFAAWQRIGFDVWVVGDDWFGHEDYMEYKRKFDEVNVRTVFFPYTKDISSTQRRGMVKGTT
jgi:glycerol-3-phosphate cytidylyltransferase